VWGTGPSQPTDSFTFQMPLPVVPLPAAPATFPVDAAPEEDEIDPEDRTVVVVRRPKAEWALVLPSGDRVLVDEVLILGRRPLAAAGPVGARRIVIDDPGRTLSRSHLIVEPHPGAGIVVRDISSANGIVLLTPEAGESAIEPGGEVRIAERCTLVLGAVEIAVEAA
jgi:hypothetical protein